MYVNADQRRRYEAGFGAKEAGVRWWLVGWFSRINRIFSSLPLAWSANPR